MNAISRDTYLRVLAAHMIASEPVKHEIKDTDDRWWFLPWLAGAALLAAILWGVL